jgi:gamma-glutamyltranspeptidase/glutathione hydrolase
MRYRIPALLLLLLVWSLASFGADRLPVRAVIASAHPLATKAGLEILDQGGNAFDAAVAVTAALAVVEPMSSGLGGGGFWLLRHGDGRVVMLDGREMAPRAARADMYLDANGDPRPRASLDGPLAAAIPGIPAGIDHLAQHYGRLPLAVSLAPAIRYADEGFPVSPRYQSLVRVRQQALMNSLAAADIFLDGANIPERGHLIRQHDLANTLRAMAARGSAGFYRGEIARRLVEGVRDEGGIWTLRDLRNYRIKERRPIEGSYRGLRVVSASPPSSGGTVLLQMLRILEGYDLGSYPAWQRKHLIIEAMRLAYRDRARYLGDSDFVSVDTDRLTSKAYAQEQRRRIDPDRATPSAALAYQDGGARGTDTTHFSIIDRHGNAVAATLSINYPFGSGFVPEGTGVVLNNEMDDFSIKPGVGNVYGLTGGAANAIAPRKRPLSSMSPTIVEDKDRLVVLGTPGGSRIISMVLLATLELADGRGSARDWVALPRYHHQFLPDAVVYEPGALSASEEQSLSAAGHSLRPRGSTYGEDSGRYGNMQAVSWHKRTGETDGANDPRGEGETGFAAGPAHIAPALK